MFDFLKRKNSSKTTILKIGVKIWLVKPDGLYQLVFKKDNDPPLRPLIDLLYRNWNNTAINTPDITNTLKPMNAFTYLYGNYTRGPVVGTGTNAVSISDYKLDTLITSGTGTGQLFYGYSSVSWSLVTASIWMHCVARHLTNFTGAGITINECGWYGDDGVNTFCFARDLVSPSVTIPSMGAAAIEYQFSS